jgi:hypothetical protein
MLPARELAVIGATIATAFVVASGAVDPAEEYTVVYAGDADNVPVAVQVIVLVTAVPCVPFDSTGVAVRVVTPTAALVKINVDVPAPTASVVILYHDPATKVAKVVLVPACARTTEPTPDTAIVVAVLVSVFSVTVARPLRT